MSEEAVDGLRNPAVDVDEDDGRTLSLMEQLGSGCFHLTDPMSPDSEYDEQLGFDDGVTMITISGDKPVLVARKAITEETALDDDDENESIRSSYTASLPFSNVHHAAIKFASIQRKIFIPNVPVHVEIIDYERSLTSHLLNPNLYTVQLTHGAFIWTVKKRYKDFYALHNQLSVFRASLNFPFPTKTHKEIRSSFRKIHDSNGAIGESVVDGAGSSRSINRSRTPLPKQKKKKGSLPRFPKRPDAIITFEAIPTRIKQLEKYLYNLLSISLYRNHHDTINFLEVSHLSFIAALGEKGREGLLKKRTGSTYPGQSGCNLLGCCHCGCCIRSNYFCADILCGRWRERWFFVKETCFGLIRPQDGVVRSVVLFDQGFDVSAGMYHTGLRNGLQLNTNSRYCVLKCTTKRAAQEWRSHLKFVASGPARDFTNPNPHMSYAPVRSGALAGWFIDGADYMSAVADALEGATEEIFIADWWLSPEIYMKRPAIDGDYWRLDQILKRKAQQGIKVFVLLFKEVELALGISSYYSKQKLVELHENIKVLRHPDHALSGIILWAHHEKIVVVDQTYGYLGGIDLCYGRWDDYNHRLTDLGSISSATAVEAGRKESTIVENPMNPMWQLMHQSKDILAATAQSKAPTSLPPIKERTEEISEHTKRNTPEMERKNYLGKLKTRGKDFIQRIAGDSDSPDEAPEPPDSPDAPETPEPPSHVELNGQAKWWCGKDYTNFILKDFVELNQPFTDQIDRSCTPRMPWHDIGCVVVGHSARDLARHFIQRWNAAKLEKAREHLSFPYLLPKSYTEIPDMRIDAFFLRTKVRLHRVTCQILRSAAQWSCGFLEADADEQSIHEAYVQCITKAQHYVYIENQFFISLAFPNAYDVRNQIAETLFKRILRAHKEKKVFRVYVVMPLLPGFEGDVGGATGNALRAITHWNYTSISRGKGSLIQRLMAAGVKNPGEYISFHSLRTHAVLCGVPCTELIYVHSKLMIVDDRTVICGSANINDRSLIGTRDSEIACIITDEAFVDGKMNGDSYPCGVFAGALREKLFKEHLGLLGGVKLKGIKKVKKNGIQINASARSSLEISESKKIEVPKVESTESSKELSMEETTSDRDIAESVVSDETKLSDSTPTTPLITNSTIDITDPTISSFWLDTWCKVSSKNTKIFDEVFRCIPTDAVQTIAQMKKYGEDPVAICKQNIPLAMEMLEEIQGNLVDLPLEFLVKETLTPPVNSKEGIMPTSLWT